VKPHVLMKLVNACHVENVQIDPCVRLRIYDNVAVKRRFQQPLILDVHFVRQVRVESLDCMCRALNWIQVIRELAPAQRIFEWSGVGL
jgi:hypothetical protein